MKPLRRLLDSIEPQFKEGKLRWAYPLYEAADTFLYTPGEVTKGPSHVRDGMDLGMEAHLRALAHGLPPDAASCRVGSCFEEPLCSARGPGGDGRCLGSGRSCYPDR